jgi:hypothetical protein
MCEHDRDDIERAKAALNEIVGILNGLSPREHARVLHSVIDVAVSARHKGSYQLTANFLNDRLLVEKGSDQAAEYWRYLASTRTDQRHAQGVLEDAKKWVTTR